jgi:hypothetical protein
MRSPPRLRNGRDELLPCAKSSAFQNPLPDRRRIACTPFPRGSGGCSKRRGVVDMPSSKLVWNIPGQSVAGTRLEREGPDPLLRLAGGAGAALPWGRSLRCGCPGFGHFMRHFPVCLLLAGGGIHTFRHPSRGLRLRRLPGRGGRVGRIGLPGVPGAPCAGTLLGRRFQGCAASPAPAAGGPRIPLPTRAVCDEDRRGRRERWAHRPEGEGCQSSGGVSVLVTASVGHSGARVWNHANGCSRGVKAGKCPQTSQK